MKLREGFRNQVKVIEFTKWLERTGGSPRDVVQRQRIRTILGMPSFRQNRRRRRSRIGERPDDLRSSMADVAEAFGQYLNIAIPQLDIVGRRRTRFEANRLADDKRVASA